MQLFYNAEIQNTSNNFVFDKEESKHIIKVLRKQENDILMVTNGSGFLFKTIITVASESKCNVAIESFEQVIPPTFGLHLAVAPTKMNERFEWFLEKATEIGIQQITPLICQNSERKLIKIDRFQKIIESAMKQSLQYFKPILNEPLSFAEFIKKDNNTAKFIGYCGLDFEKLNFKKVLPLGQDITFLIGPEGDFTTNEVQMAMRQNYKTVALGATRLRTETAALVACHSFVFANENI